MVHYDEAVKQEVQRLSAELPKPEDIPQCMQLLDNFFKCYGTHLLSEPTPTKIDSAIVCILALGAQMKSLYRFGRTSECSHKFQDFKFCLSNKNLSEEEKRTAWIQRRGEWWASRRVERSSEDVWEIRT